MENNKLYPSRDEVFEYLVPRVEKFPFKAEVVKEGGDKIVIRQVLYDSRLQPNGNVEVYILIFTEGNPMVGYFSPREVYFGGETPYEIWRSICRLIGKPQLYDL